MAKVLRTGEYGTKDSEKALSLFEASAAHGSGDAMVSLAQMHFSGEAASKNIALSCRWAVLAHTKGRKAASAHIADVCRSQLSKDELQREIEEAKRWIDEHPDAYGPASKR